MKQAILLIKALLLGGSVTAQVVTGVIKDNDGGPVVGATVLVKGTNVSAVANVEGQFTIAAQKVLPFTLLIRSVGFKGQEVDVYEFGEPLDIVLVIDNVLEEVVVTSRRREEVAQDVPVPITLITGSLAADAGAFNVNRLKELIPSVQLYSSNPRNTALNIRGLGTTFGLTNDGIEPGVGFYVDGVYYARPAATSLDFIDIQQIEVLRGPQGTLFGKNTTAGAFNVTTRKPSFTTGANFEMSYGSYGFIQAKTSITGPITRKIAARLSFSGTQRDGLLFNVATQRSVNDLNNQGVRAQVLFTPSDVLEITVAGDVWRQRPDGYAQVIAGIAPTLRAPYRQFDQIIADLNYTLPSYNPFDRVVDHDTPWRSDQDLGGTSMNVNVEWGTGTLTSTSAWRFWSWNPSNDRDFTGLPVLTLSQAPSKHRQWSQEVRWAGTLSSRLSTVLGVFLIGQDLRSDPYHTEESGSAQWRFCQSSPSALWTTPGLLEGYGIRTTSSLKTHSGAVFSQFDWKLADRLNLLTGLRVNYDEKKIDFNRQTYGGLRTADPQLIALKNSVYSDQAFEKKTDNTNLSGQLTIAFKAAEPVKTYLTYSTNYKSIGLNLGGLPTAAGAPMLELAVIKPEYVRHVEAGVKTTPSPTSTINLTLYNTDIRDFQTQVQTAEVGVNRGYLANAERVRVRGAEIDGTMQVSANFSLYGSLAYTDGKYVTFTNAPVPLEATGGSETFRDISGSELPGISKWAFSLGGEVALPGKFFGQAGRYFLASDNYYRGLFSSSPTPSEYLVVDGYSLSNARLGFKATAGASIFLWSRNLLNKDYFEQLLPAGGNAGHYAGVLGDPRTVGVTVRYSF